MEAPGLVSVLFFVLTVFCSRGNFFLRLQVARHGGLLTTLQFLNA